MGRPDTPHLCVQKEHRGKRQNWLGSQDGKLGEKKHQGSEKHHIESNKIWRDEAMKTLKKLMAGTGKMGHCRGWPPESICCKSREIGRGAQCNRNPSRQWSYRLVRLLMRMMCFKERSTKEVGQVTHEGVLKSLMGQKWTPSHISLVKISAGFVLLATCLTDIILSWTHLQMELSRNSMCQAALEVMLWDHLMQASLYL